MTTRHSLTVLVAAGVVAARGAARHGAMPAALEGERTIAAAIHAAKLQLPESWIPFVVSR